MKFSELKPGDHFSLAFKNHQWVKTTTCPFEQCSCCTRNAVSLHDGSYLNIDLNAKVQINGHWE